MALDSLRSAREALAYHWTKTAGVRIRAALLAAVALGGLVVYARTLGLVQPVRDWLFWRLGMLWLWGLVLSAGCVSTGHLILTRLLRIKTLPTLEHLVQSAALGLLAFVMGIYAGGFAHQLNTVFAVALPAVMVAAGARSFYGFVKERRAAWLAEPPPPARDPFRRAIRMLAGAFGVVGVGLMYLQLMTPDAINFDSSWSHLPIGVDYARHHAIIPFDGDYTRNFPHLPSLVHTWAMLVPHGPFHEPALRWMQAQHLEFIFFLWTLASVAAMARWLLDDSRTGSLWAVFFLFPSILVYDSNLGGGADHYLAFFACPFFLAAMRAAQRFDARESAMAGAFGAGALLSKYQAIYLIVGVVGAFGIKWLWALADRFQAHRAAKNPPVAATEGSSEKPAPEPPPTWRALLVAPAAMALTALLVTSPHFLRNWVFYHNPMYPFAQDVFKSTPTTHNAAYLFEWLFKDYNHRPHGTFRENVRDAIGLVFTFSFQPHYSFTKSVPNMGSLFTLCMPLVLFVRSPKRIWLGYAAGVGALFAWGMIFRVDRHLQTFMPLLVATTAAIIVRAWDLGWIARIGLVPLVALQVIWGGDAAFYNSQPRLQSAMDLIKSGYEGHAANRFDGYRRDQIALGKSLPPDAKVLLHMYRPNLGIDRDIVLDWAGQQGLILFEDLHGPKNAWEYLRSKGITHLLQLPGFRASVTKQQDVLFYELVSKYAVEKKRFGGMEVMALAPKAPPPDHAYHVLSLGLGGYRDGEYPLEAMKTYEGVAENQEKFAPPSKSWPRDPAAQRALVDECDAVLLGDRAKSDSATKSYVEQGFMNAQALKGFSVYLRKVGAPPPKGVAPAAAPEPGKGEPEPAPTHPEEPPSQDRDEP